MWSAPNVRDKIKCVDVVVSINHVTFWTNSFLRRISLQISTIFVSGTSGITATLKYRSVNPISLQHVHMLKSFVLSMKLSFCTINLIYYALYNENFK